MKQKKRVMARSSKWLSIMMVLSLFLSQLPLSIVYAETAEEPLVVSEELAPPMPAVGEALQEPQEIEPQQPQELEKIQEPLEAEAVTDVSDPQEPSKIAETPQNTETETAENATESNIGTGTITGSVWLDANEDGLYADDESALAEIVVYLVDAHDKTQRIEQAVTDAVGTYEFAELAPGEYSVAIDDQTHNDRNYLAPVASLQTGTDNKFDTDQSDEDGLSYTENLSVVEDDVITDIDAGMRLQRQISPQASGKYEVRDASSSTVGFHETLAGAVELCNNKGPGSYTIYLTGDDPAQGETVKINDGFNITLTSAASSASVITQTVKNPEDLYDKSRHFIVNKGSLILTNIILEGEGKPYDHAKYGADNGGVRLENGGSLTVGSNAVMTKCFGNTGAAIEATDGSKVYLIDNASIHNNQSSDRGGGIYANNSTVDISGSLADESTDEISISNNIGHWRTGGIHLENGSDLTLAGKASITGNIAKHNEAGGIYVDPNSSVTMNGGSLTSNVVEDGGNGGGIYINKNGTVTMSNGEISGNKSVNGAGIYINGGILNALGGTIQDNTASVHGGGIFITGGTLNVVGGSIQSNTASGDGGGIRATDRAVVTIAGTSKIIENTAAYGGGISANGGSTITMEAGEISQNNGGSRGGGVNLDTNSTTFTMTGGTVSGNTATTGSGILVDKATISLTKATITDNKATGDKAGEGYGGGVYVQNKGKATIEGSTISNNTAYAGGGVYISEESQDLTITNSTISENQTLEHGGGLLVEGTNAVIENVDFTFNDAQGYGGGIRLSSNANVTIENSKISANISQYGGGISANLGSKLSLTGTNITKNQAVYRGTEGGDGAGVNIDLENTEFTMTGGSLTENVAESSGGGVFATAHSSFNLIGVTITDNTAATHGGGLFLKEDVSGHVEGSNILKNSTVVNGGGARLESCSSLTIEDSLVNENTAAYGGGVSANTGSKVTMSGAASQISKNVTTHFGGGVNIDNVDTIFTMDAGTIGENPATNGGGVFASDNAQFIMEGGTITTNSARNNGAGLYLQANAVLQVASGSIVNNKAAGSGGGIFTEDYYYRSPVDAASYYKNITINDGSVVSGNTSVKDQTPPDVVNENLLKFKKEYLNNDEVNYYPDSYKLVYEPNGGTGMAFEERYLAMDAKDVTVKSPTDAGGIGAPAAHPDYIFYYWAENDDGSGAHYAGDGTATITMNGDKVLYAIWGPPTAISGVVFLDDQTRNANYDSGEELKDRVVTLYKYDEQKKEYTYYKETTTDGFGRYTFVVESNAKYKVFFKVIDGNVGQHGFVKKGSRKNENDSHANHDGFSDEIPDKISDEISSDATIGGSFTVNAGYVPDVVPTGVSFDSSSGLFYLALSVLLVLVLRKLLLIHRFQQQTEL